MSGGPLVSFEASSEVEARWRHAGRMRFIITSSGSENRPLDPGRAGALHCFSRAPVAQMDRAVASGATGRRFESCQAYQLSDFRVTTHAQPAATLANPGSCAITHGELAGPNLQNRPDGNEGAVRAEHDAPGHTTDLRASASILCYFCRAFAFIPTERRKDAR
jgi:hypothetical protein